jgi:uncharacterized protein (TIGR03435 family)
MKLTIFAVSVAAAIAIPAFSQVSPETKPSFEVASVKPNVSGEGYMDGTPGGRFIATGVPLRMLIIEAYNVRGVQVIGGPNWMNSERWDVEGKPKAGDVAAPPPTVRDPGVTSRESLMLQSLLEDRFQLKSHRETRELPVYELTVAKNGPKLKTSTGVPSGRPRMRMSRGTLEAYETSLAGVVRFLSNQVDRMLIDRTGLQGLYDINLKWDPEARRPVAPDGAAPGVEPTPNQPSIFTAVQEQLGLKLEAAKAPVEVLVIDSVQRPTEN